MTSTEIEESEMSHTASGPAVNKDGEALARPFGKHLLPQAGAQDFHDSCRGKSDTELLAYFIITKELRRKTRSLAIRIRTCCGGSTPFTPQWGSDRGAARRDGIANTRDEPMEQRARAFYGRQLVVCRDVHQFGSETNRKLADAGTKLVDDATAATADLARAWKKPILREDHVEPG